VVSWGASGSATAIEALTGATWPFVAADSDIVLLLWNWEERQW